MVAREAGSARLRVLLERMLLERVLAVLLSWWRAAMERARWRCRVRLVTRLVGARLIGARRRGAMPQAAGPARGHAGVWAAVPRGAVGLASETLRTVRAGRTASWPARKGGASWWEWHFGEARSGTLNGPGASVALMPVLSRASAVAWPGAGVGRRLPVPTP